MFKKFLLLLMAPIAAIAFAVPAFAHVTISPSEVPTGSTDEIKFSVPNEEDSATTTAFSVQFPDSPALPSVSVKPVTGWTYKVTTKTLSTPIKTDDGDISTVVTQIDWTASADGAIKAGEYQDFPVSIDGMPDSATTLEFKAIQTYSNGDVVRWIEDTPASGAEPEHPAPVLKVVAEKADTTTAATTTAKPKDSTARTFGIVGIALGAVAFLLAVRPRRHS